MQVLLPYRDLEKSAQALDDARLGAQINDAIKLICAMENEDYFIKNKSTTQDITNKEIYKIYHSKEGKLFLVMYVLRLCEEWYHRFDKQHQAFFTIDYFRTQYEEDLLFYSDFFDGNIFDVFQPKYIKGRRDVNQIIATDNIHRKYQQLLFDKWATEKRKPVWTNREAPVFYSDKKVLKKTGTIIE